MRIYILINKTFHQEYIPTDDLYSNVLPARISWFAFKQPTTATAVSISIIRGKS